MMEDSFFYDRFVAPDEPSRWREITISDTSEWTAEDVKALSEFCSGGPTFVVWQAINRETNEVVAEELDPSDALGKARLLGVKSPLIVCDYRRQAE